MKMEILKEDPVLLVAKAHASGFGVLDLKAEIVIVRVWRREFPVQQPMCGSPDGQPPTRFTRDGKTCLRLAVLKDSYRKFDEDGFKVCQFDNLYVVVEDLGKNGGFHEKHEGGG